MCIWFLAVIIQTGYDDAVEILDKKLEEMWKRLDGTYQIDLNIWEVTLLRRFIMDIKKLKTFFMWCVIINGILLVFSFAFCILLPDLIYNIHGKLFNIDNETLNVLIYLFLGIFKIFWLIFNVTPYVTLIILEKKNWLRMKALCYCGSQKFYGECCFPLISGSLKPKNPEQLMRSRYSAFCIKNIEYLISSHHPCRLLQKQWDRAITWEFKIYLWKWTMVLFWWCNTWTFEIFP